MIKDKRKTWHRYVNINLYKWLHPILEYFKSLHEVKRWDGDIKKNSSMEKMARLLMLITDDKLVTYARGVNKSPMDVIYGFIDKLPPENNQARSSFVNEWVGRSKDEWISMYKESLEKDLSKYAEDMYGKV